MKIASVEAIPLSIPYTYGASGYTLGAQRAQVLDMCLVRVETEDGRVGWGDAFAYSSRTAVTAAVRDMVAPLAIGLDATDIAAIALKLQKALHIFGRYGITMHALSGLDIALWDLAGKRAGKPLHALIGGVPRHRVPAYASLLRYGNAELVAQYASRAVEQGFAAIKLHETDESVIAAARAAVPGAVPLMFDVNCPWTPDQAVAFATRLAAHQPEWLEEPVFPPEDFAGLRRVRESGGVPVAAGENWCTVVQFRQALAAGAVDIVQPSVAKVGGVSEFLQVIALAREYGVRVAPHSPYYGPGALATLHLLTCLPEPVWFELFYLNAEAALFGEALKAVNGVMAIPQGPGLGCDPDPDVIARYRTDR
jgi:L-alanine-DL-glutamate epimerase-like enolase superfamily enzyme